jgi:serine protease AprX
MLFAATGLFAANPFGRLSADATRAASVNDSVQVIVQWKIPTGPATQQKIAALRGTVVSDFQTLNSGLYQIPSVALATLDQDSQVAFVSLDRQVSHKLAYTAAAINAASVWKSGYNGSGIGIAIVDSGVNVDPNLGVGPHSNIVYSRDFTHPGPNGDPSDHYGHGQHISGIIASNGQASSCPTCTETFLGIAPGASLINLKVLDDNGAGSDSRVLAAIDTAILLKDRYNIRVLNLSLGRPILESYTRDPLCQAAEAAWKAGIVVVAAAGNEGRDNSFSESGYGTITAPGNDPYVITVGAMKAENTFTRADDLIASYSSKGPTTVDHVVKPDVLAPGNQIVSLLAPNSALLKEFPANQVPVSAYVSNGGNANSHVYFLLNGTSMATAVVSAAAADVLQAYPSLTPDQIKVLFMQTASKTFPTSSSVTDPNDGTVYTSYYDLFTVGAGYIDMQAALKAAGKMRGVTGNSISPSASYNAGSGTVTLSFDPSSLWVTQPGGLAPTWGTTALSGNVALWNGIAPWGQTSTASASPAGAAAIWNSTSLWVLALQSGNAAQMSMWGACTPNGQMSMWGACAPNGQMSMWGANALSEMMSMWGAGTPDGLMSMWGATTDSAQLVPWAASAVADEGISILGEQ